MNMKGVTADKVLENAADQVNADDATDGTDYLTDNFHGNIAKERVPTPGARGARGTELSTPGLEMDTGITADHDYVATPPGETLDHEMPDDKLRGPKHNLRDKTVWSLKLLRDRLNKKKAELNSRKVKNQTLKKKAVKVVSGKFLELFAGEGRLTKTVAEHAPAMSPKDLFNEMGQSTGSTGDLLLRRNQVKVLKEIRLGRIRWLHAAPPCNTLSEARRSDEHGSAKVLRTRERPEGLDPTNQRVWEANELAKFTAKACRAMLRAGGWFSIENQNAASCGS